MIKSTRVLSSIFGAILLCCSTRSACYDEQVLRRIQVYSAHLKATGKMPFVLNISCANLSHAPLNGLDLTGAICVGTFFKGAKMAGTIFRKANFCDAHLTEVVCNGTDFTGATFNNTYFDGAILCNVLLANAYIRAWPLRSNDDPAPVHLVDQVECIDPASLASLARSYLR